MQDTNKYGLTEADNLRVVCVDNSKIMVRQQIEIDELKAAIKAVIKESWRHEYSLEGKLHNLLTKAGKLAGIDNE